MANKKLEMTASRSLRDEITLHYYRTTSGRGHRRTREYYELAAALLKRRLGPWAPQLKEARCLDLACGCGEMLYCLERNGIRNTAGVDLCREEIDEGRLFVRGSLIHSDVLDYLRQTDSKSFDFITAFNFLEHLPKDYLKDVLFETRRILRPGGALVGMVPNSISPFSGITRYWDITHEWAFSPNNFRQLAALTGFDPTVEFRECGPVPHGPVSGIRYLIWQLIRLGISGWLLVELADRKGSVYTMDMLVRLRSPRTADDAQ
jgi:2-polyprenyl-3-methyl-5-hydroxy-6-metoxy-1,4-benzoquinol methylase